MIFLIFILGFFSFSGALALRHYWFQTSAWDLGIFDQATYLISRGIDPQSSFLGFHILGDHGALVLYPIGWLSSIFPSVFLLFILQGAALASAVFPLAKLAKQNRLNRRYMATSLLVLLLYPVVFNTAIFDFHPEVLAFPLILEIMVLIDDNKNRSYFKIFIYLVFALTCKITMSFLVIGIGLKLIIDNKKKLGLAISSLAITWFVIFSSFIIPIYGGEDARLDRHFGKFGLSKQSVFDLDSVYSSIIQLLSQFFSLSNLTYLILLLLPVIYLLFHSKRIKIFTNLLPFLPLLLLNLFSSQSSLKDLVHQYSLFLVPFLAIEVQKTLSTRNSGIKGYPIWMHRRGATFILAWTVLMFIILSRFTFYFGNFQGRFDTAKERREAISIVGPEVSLLTSNDLAPHLSRREKIYLISEETFPKIDSFDEVLLDKNHPGWNSSSGLIEKISDRLEKDSSWSVKFREGKVVLFQNNDSKLSEEVK